MSKGIVHLHLKMIMELLIGDVGRGNRHEYCVLALNLTDPVKEDVIALVGTEDFCTQGPCPVRLEHLLLKLVHKVGKGNHLQSRISRFDPP